jgi:hypothetical protein
MHCVVWVHLAPMATRRTAGPACRPWMRGSRQGLRLRASGLNTPARRTRERHSAGACATTSAGFTPYEGSSDHHGHRDEHDQGRRAERKVLGRRGCAADDRVRRTVLCLVRAVRAMGVVVGVPTCGHGRRNGSRGHRRVRLLGHSVDDGAQHERHHQGGTGRRAEPAPPGRAARGAGRRCGRRGRSRHKSSALPTRRRVPGRSETQAWVGAGRHRRNVTARHEPGPRHSSRDSGRTGDTWQAGRRTAYY